jgi:Mn-dependent DtxR family transcriptional regulator
MARSNEQRVLQALQELGGAATPEQIAKRLNWSTDMGTRRSIGHTIRRLIEQGLIRHRERAVLYELTDRV